MSGGEEFRDDSVQEAPVRGFLHHAGAGGDGLVLTHGAGADCRTPLLRALAEAFNQAGEMVLRCDLPFRQARPYGPPPRGRAEDDRRGLRAAVDVMRRQTKGCVFLGGHSYGGRQASMLAAEDPAVTESLLLLSYPLHPPKKPQEMRTGHFPSLRTPALFVSGERDAFATREELEMALKLIPARVELMVVPGAGHELITSRNRGELPGRIAQAFLKFASSL